MPTRERPRQQSSSQNRSSDASFSPLRDEELNEISDEELDMLFSRSSGASSDRFGRIATATGLGMLLVMALFLIAEFTTISFLSPQIGAGLVAMIAAIIGFVVFSGSRKKTKSATPSSKSSSRSAEAEMQRKLEEKMAEARAAIEAEREAEETSDEGLRRSSNKKLMGVCAGLAEYFGLDITLVRAAFLIGLVVSGGNLAIVYFGMAYIMPKADDA